MVGFLRKSTTTSLVFEGVRLRQFRLHHSAKMFISDCSCPGVFVVSMITVSSEYLMYVMPGLVLLQSSVYRVYKTGEITEPCGAPVETDLDELR